MANTISRYEQANGATTLPDLVDRFFRDGFITPQLMNRATESFRPTFPVNLFETKDAYVLHAALPGLNLDNLDIQVMGRRVTIQGKFEINTPEGGNWLWQGIPTGEFGETFSLPVEVDSARTEATYEGGILSVLLPKSEHARPTSIKVTAK
jgi:HSP20 family protein